MVGTEALERILGERPFVSDEMRNIDKFRGGFAPTASDAAKLDAANPPSDSSATGSGAAPLQTAAAEQPTAAAGSEAAAGDDASPADAAAPQPSSPGSDVPAESACGSASQQQHSVDDMERQNGPKIPPGSIVAS